MTDTKKEVTTPQTVQDRIKDKIKDTFLDLVSEEEWRTLISKSIDSFTKPKSTGYGNNNTPSELELMVHKELREHFLVVIREELYKYVQYGYGSDGNAAVNDLVKQMITENAQSIFANMISGTIQNVVNSLQNNIQQY